MQQDKVTARIMMEVIGSPKEHVEASLKEVVQKFGDDEKVRVKNENSYNAEKLDNGFWSAFSEVEFETGDIKELLDVCFDYTPSTLEILEPAGITIDTAYLASLFNDLLAKMHQFVAAIKNSEAENILLKKELNKLRNKE